MIKYDRVENHSAYVGTTRPDLQCIRLSNENHGVVRGESRRGYRRISNPVLVRRRPWKPIGWNVLTADGKYLCFCILLLKVRWETFASKLCSTTDVRNDYPLIDIRFHSDSKGSFHSNGITLITRARYFTWLASYRFDRASRSFDFTPKFS